MHRKLAILDRDGTIIEEKPYLSDPDQVELLPGAAEALRLLREMGMTVVVATNQSGVGRGYFDLHTLDLIHQRMSDLLETAGSLVDRIYFCPHHPDYGCSCRKPSPGMARQAAEDFNLDLSSAVVIGDLPSDITLGERIEALTFLVRTGHGHVWAEDPSVAPDFVADNLLDAALKIAEISQGIIH